MCNKDGSFTDFDKLVCLTDAVTDLFPTLLLLLPSLIYTGLKVWLLTQEVQGSRIGNILTDERCQRDILTLIPCFGITSSRFWLILRSKYKILI